MRRLRLRGRAPRAVAIAAVGVALATLPAAAGLGGGQGDQVRLAHLSQAVVLHYYAAHPDQAPVALRARLAEVRAAAGSVQPSAGVGAHSDAFNHDFTGLPQNEESVVACKTDHRIVLGGANDYRYLLNPSGNSTGWYLSTDSGRSVAEEGLLPTIDIAGVPTPSGGDPVQRVDAACNLYFTDLNYDPDNPDARNGIGVYRTDAATLLGCPGGDDPSCWPMRRAVAVGAPNHFLDKPWFDVGRAGPNGRQVVWVTYSDFNDYGPGELDFTASIYAVRCEVDLTGCTQPIKISGDERDVQFSYVTIGKDGRTYVTWSHVKGELTQNPQTFVHELRIAPAGSTTFGPAREIATETKPLPFGGLLHANNFRVATVLKNAVLWMGDHSRIFTTWDACRERVLDTICEEPQIDVAWSDDDGATWTRSVVSLGGDNYFPAISADNDTNRLALTWYTNRFDPVFHNRGDVELAWLREDGSVESRTRVTRVSNEWEADPLFQGAFIGDYFDVFADKGTAWVHFNANYRSVPLLGQGAPVPQEDNFLAVEHLR